MTIGTVADWPIKQARDEAQRLKVIVDGGTDPRELERQKLADKATEQATSAIQAVTVREVWASYVEQRKPYWSTRHYQDHFSFSKAGGIAVKRGTHGRGVTIDAPLHSLMHLPLRDLSAPVIEAWAAEQAKTRKTSGQLCLRLLKAFLNWCAEQPQYAPILPAVNAAKTKKSRQVLGKAGVKRDALTREQLSAWFAAVRNISNPTISAALQTMLLTGARSGEVVSIKWADIDQQWRGLTIHDDLQGDRVIPLTPYVWQLMSMLPRRNEWVFSSPTSASGQLVNIRKQHVAACKTAGVESLTKHGLRRSFKSLTEWLEVPVGVVAQLMGHKPSATAEKHYTVRPLDLLRIHHEKIEAWILEQAGLPASTPTGSILQNRS